MPSVTLMGMGLNGMDNAGISIGQADKSGLPDEVRAAIGDRPVIQLTLDGVRTAWNNPDYYEAVGMTRELGIAAGGGTTGSTRGAISRGRT